MILKYQHLIIIMIYNFYMISILSKPEYTYVGYTTNFKNRKNKHKTNLTDKTKINMPLYKTINENGGWDNVYMEIIEKGEYDNLKDVYKKERELIDLHNTTMNGHLPSKIDINYSENPKEYKAKWEKDYVKNNPEKYKEKMKKDNEERKEYKAKWHQDNKKRISEKLSKKVMCNVCNIEVCQSSIHEHNKSINHLILINEEEKIIEDKRRIKVMCDICNIEVCQFSLRNHNKTKKHLSNLSI